MSSAIARPSTRRLRDDMGGRVVSCGSFVILGFLVVTLVMSTTSYLDASIIRSWARVERVGSVWRRIEFRESIGSEGSGRLEPRSEPLEHLAGRDEVGGVETFREPVVDRFQNPAGFGGPVLVFEEHGELGGGS